MSAFGQIKIARPASSSDTLTLDGIIKTNSATIGVTHTYDPVGYVPGREGVARWVDRSGGIQVGYPSIELSVRNPINNGARMNRVTMVVALPTLEQTSASTASGIQPAPTKAYDHFFRGEWLLPERGLLWERQSLLYTVICLLNATVTASDGAPSDSTSSPFGGAITAFDRPY